MSWIGGDQEKAVKTSILDVVEDTVEKILITEALILKRIGIDNVPLPLNEKRVELENEIRKEDEEKLRFLHQYDQQQEVNDLVKEFVSAAASAAVALHQEIEAIPQNRPFGGSTTVERLMIENLNLMNAILVYDDNTSSEYWTDDRIGSMKASFSL